MNRPDWFPDWSGDICAVVAAGSSTTQRDVDRLHDRCRVAVVNRSFELAPWADVIYAADGRFWEHYPAARNFAGLKVTADRAAAKQWGLYRVTVSGEHVMKAELGTVGHGGTSSFQALNLVVQFGVRHILLLGFDFCGEHWHGAHKGPLQNPRPQTLQKWRTRLDVQAGRLVEMGITVINGSPKSALTAYDKMPAAAALNRLGVLVGDAV